MSDVKKQTQTNTQIKERVKTKKPKMYKVLIHNDDYTPMDFVVHVLEVYFQRSETEASQIMLNVHHKGIGVAGIYTKDIAETKSQMVNQCSKSNSYPLKTSIQRDENETK